MSVRALMKQVKRQTAGMLPAEVYVRLHEAAGAAGGGTFLELGTAQGAATIALALGAREAGRPFHILSADPFDRGSRLRIGSIEDNLALVRRGFEAFGVADAVTLVPGMAAALAARPDAAGATLLLIDADGRIDRDLALLYPLLAPDAAIIIDDVDPGIVAHPAPGGWTIDQKHRLTHLLVEAFIGMGMLIPEATVRQTGFYRKGTAAPEPREIEAAALGAYRELVFPHLDRRQLGWKRAMRRVLARRAPWAIAGWMKVRHGE